MRVQFHNPALLLIKFKTLINPNSSLQYQRFVRHLGFFSTGSWNSSVCSHRKIVVTTPMATANPTPLPLRKPRTREVVEGIARKCFIKCKKDADMCLLTPFVLALAAGNLKLDSFRHYIAQDIHFLKAYAQAYELAEECADDDDAKIGIRKLRKNILEELKMHGEFIQWCMEEWGIDVAKETNPNLATVKYTEFLLATAQGKVEVLKTPVATPFEKTRVAAYTLGAMTPCMRLYAFLGKELLALLDNGGSSHPYKKWIDIYSSENFQASAQQTEDLLDKLCVSLTCEELNVIKRLYKQAMKLELDFFLAQPLDQKIVVPLSKGLREAEDRLVIFSDFDLTCTVLDSSAVLAEIAIVTASKFDKTKSDKTTSDQTQSDKTTSDQTQSDKTTSDQTQSDQTKSDQTQSEDQISRMSSADLRNIWEVLSKEYTDEYEQCVENILLTENANKFEYESLRKALEPLSNFEKNANTRVIESGVLKGLDIKDIRRAGEHLMLQDGCTNFFQSIIRNENLTVDIHVLSYCWCADLIRASFSSGGLDALKIHANEFNYDDGGITTGEIVRKMESPIDKVETFSKILQDSGKDRRNLTIYIGDTVGDLLCLLEADIGIVIGSSPNLRRLGTHFGASFIPLFSGLVEKQKEFPEKKSGWKGRSGIIYTVSSWAEIHALFLGFEGSG